MGADLMSGDMTVITRNICPDLAAQLAAGLAPLPLGLALRGQKQSPSVILFDAAQDDDLAPLLSQPVAAIIDVNCHDPLGGLPRLPSSLLVRLSTVMALHRDIAGPLTATLCQRIPQIRSSEAALRTALQEAIGNAVLHGNLGLDGRLRKSLDGLVVFARMMDARSKDPVFSHRPVTIAADWNARALMVTVEDRGAGFAAPRNGTPLPVATATCGRGLAEIRAACARVNIIGKGRRISMRFNLDQG